MGGEVVILANSLISNLLQSLRHSALMQFDIAPRLERAKAAEGRLHFWGSSALSRVAI